MPTEAHRPTRRPPPRKRSSRRRKRRRGYSRLLAFWPLAVPVLLVAVLLALLLRSCGSRTTAKVNTDLTTLSAQTIPENTYDEEGFTTDSDGTVTYEDEYYYSVQGIDISSHQGDIDWTALAEEELGFAILRIGYRGYTAGALNADTAFEANYSGAKSIGLQVGVYFYSQAITVEEAKEEAEYVLELLKGLELDLPVFYDWEKQTASGSRTLDSDVSILTECALAFCQTIENGGFSAGIYFYSSLALDTYDLSYLTDYTFWLSQPGEVPDFDYDFAFWQYSYTGSLEGISAKVDLNMMLVSTGE